jgi:hypothetical protein
MKQAILLLLLVTSHLLFAQSVISDTNLTLDEVLESITTNLECTSISNVTSQNNALMHGNSFNSYGSFEFTNEPFFPFEKGIVLSTADPTDLSNIVDSGNYTWPGDADLEALIQQPGNTHNATSIEFDFVPFRDHLKVDYILASNEYPQWVCQFADTFAFIVSGPGISNVNSYDHDANPNTPEIDLDLGGKNIATFPGTNIIINPCNAHDGTTSCGSGTLGEYTVPALYDVQNSGNNILDFNGQVIPLTAEIDLIPGQTYHIKLVIADRGDTIFDSAVFIDANSFVIGTIPEDLPYSPGLPVTLPDCWTESESANFTINSQCSSDGSNYIQLFGGDYSITTAAVDTEAVSGVDISFDLLNGCSDVAEAGKNLIVEYFDGSTWQLLDDIDPINIPTPFSEDANEWTTFSYTVTSGMSKNFMLRFVRSGGDDQMDDISLTNLVIENTTLSNQEFNENQNFVIFPNPIHNALNIKSQNNVPMTKAELIDLSGRIIHSETIDDLSEVSLNLYNIKAGVYIVKIYSETHYVTRKIIKH